MNELIDAIKEHGDLDDETIIDAGKHGADAGWGGFTYTGDCVEFYDENKALIWELLEQGADEMGCKSVPEFVGQFNRSDMAGDEDGFKNLCAWYALEEAGRWLENEIDSLREEETDAFREAFDTDTDEGRKTIVEERPHPKGWDAETVRKEVESLLKEEDRDFDPERVNWDEIADEWNEIAEEQEEAGDDEE